MALRALQKSSVLAARLASKQAQSAAAPAGLRRFLFSAPGSRERLLERAARLNEREAARQAEYLRELNKTNPQAVIKRFESAQFAANEECAREYLAALAKTSRAHAGESLGDAGMCKAMAVTFI